MGASVNMDFYAERFISESESGIDFKVFLSGADVSRLLDGRSGGIASLIEKKGIQEWVAPNLCLLPSPLKVRRGWVILGEWDDERVLVASKNGGVWAKSRRSSFYFSQDYVAMLAALYLYEQMVASTIAVDARSYVENRVGKEVLSLFNKSIFEFNDVEMASDDSFWMRQISWHASGVRQWWFEDF